MNIDQVEKEIAQATLLAKEASRDYCYALEYSSGLDLVRTKALAVLAEINYTKIIANALVESISSSETHISVVLRYANKLEGALDSILQYREVVK